MNIAFNLGVEYTISAVESIVIDKTLVDRQR